MFCMNSNKKLGLWNWSISICGWIHKYINNLSPYLNIQSIYETSQNIISLNHDLKLFSIVVCLISTIKCRNIMLINVKNIIIILYIILWRLSSLKIWIMNKIINHHVIMSIIYCRWPHLNCHIIKLIMSKVDAHQCKKLRHYIMLSLIQDYYHQNKKNKKYE